MEERERSDDVYEVDDLNDRILVHATAFAYSWCRVGFVAILAYAVLSLLLAAIRSLPSG